ncbi:MAG: hypothetical protein V1739_07935 [Candidatus Omnitrophota bacterium]
MGNFDMEILQTMRKAIYILLTLFVVLCFFSKGNRVILGPGVKAAEDPHQVPISFVRSFEFKDFKITPLAEFSIKAKVLSRKNYNQGRSADLSPVDLALGWGKMSDEAILQSIKIWQANRWYWWWTRKFPIARSEIETHSANMHIIPANETVKEALKGVRRGDIVEFEGSLVKVQAKDGWSWGSSLIRNDIGAHSCELVWVEVFDIIKPD